MRSVVDGLASWIVALLYAVLLCAGLAQVASRYIFEIAIPWTEELAIYVFIWLVFIGAALGISRNVHPRVEAIPGLLAPRLRRMLMLAIDLIVVVFLCLLIFYGYRMVLLTSSNVTPALGASVGYAMYLSLPVGAALMILNIALRWFSPSARDETDGHLDL